MSVGRESSGILPVQLNACSNDEQKKTKILEGFKHFAENWWFPALDYHFWQMFLE